MRVAAMNQDKYGGVVAWLLAGPLRETSANVVRRVSERADKIALAARELPPTSDEERVAYVAAREENETTKRIKAYLETDILRLHAEYGPFALSPDRAAEREKKTSELRAYYQRILDRTRDLLTADAVAAVNI
jgi:hypothetical protein